MGWGVGAVPVSGIVRAVPSFISSECKHGERNLTILKTIHPHFVLDKSRSKSCQTQLLCLTPEMREICDCV